MNYAKLRDELVEDEGLRLKPYRDTGGTLTIGIGRNLDDNGIRRDEVELMFRNDVAAVEGDLDRLLPWWRSLDDVRQRVLANMMFNLGAPKLLGFSTTLRLVQNGDYAEASRSMLKSLWASQVGNRARRLSEMMRTGEDRPAPLGRP